MAISGPQELYDIVYVTRRIQKYGGIWPYCESGDIFPSDCEGNCNTGSRCTPKSTFRGDFCIWACNINPLGDWLSVAECSIQIKYFFHATAQADGKKHDIIWEANVDQTGAVNWTYACLSSDKCSPPRGTYSLTNNENWLQSCPPNRGVDSGSDCSSAPKYYNYCANPNCGCFACDQDRAQHFVTKNPWK